MRFTLEPGASHTIGELKGKLGPKLTCMMNEIPRGEHEVRASAAIQSKQQTCARSQKIKLE